MLSLFSLFSLYVGPSLFSSFPHLVDERRKAREGGVGDVELAVAQLGQGVVDLTHRGWDGGGGGRWTEREREMGLYRI